MKLRSLARLALGISAAAPAAAKNPVLAGADPHVVVIDNTFWLYPTHAKGPGSRFFAYASDDLIQWKEHGPILDFNDIPWTRANHRPHAYAWAPCLIQHADKFHFFYAVGPQNEKFPAHIGVAVGDSPAGPFIDSGQPLLTGGNGFEAIDPFVFHDTVNNRHLLFAGGSAGATLKIFTLHPSLTRLGEEIPTITPPHFTEGPFLHKHNDLYHLTYSHGSWRHASYSVHHATSSSPTGPWQYRGCILKSDAQHKGPGHHSIIRHPSQDDWLIIYHRWNHREGNGPYTGSRAIAIELLQHTQNGEILPIKMTETGPLHWQNLNPAAQPPPKSADGPTPPPPQ